MLKTLEGTAKLQQNLISSSKTKSIQTFLPSVKKALKPVKDQLNPDKTNASYLLGVDGLVTMAMVHLSRKQL